MIVIDRNYIFSLLAWDWLERYVLVAQLRLRLLCNCLSIESVWRGHTSSHIFVITVANLWNPDWVSNWFRVREAPYCSSQSVKYPPFWLSIEWIQQLQTPGVMLLVEYWLQAARRLISSSLQHWTTPILAPWLDRFQIQNPHLYLRVNRISFKFKFKIRIAPLRRPHWLFQIQNPHLSCLSIRSNSIGVVSYCPTLEYRWSRSITINEALRDYWCHYRNWWKIAWVLISISQSIQNCLTIVRDQLSIDIVITINQSKFLNYWRGSRYRVFVWRLCIQYYFFSLSNARVLM